MTVVLAVVTTDGLVLASDSATTQRLPTVEGIRTASIWNSANKIVNLRKPWPIGAMTFGRATFKGRSIATHCKDLRLILSGQATHPDHPELAKNKFTVEEVAESIQRYFRTLYSNEPGGTLGFLVGGFTCDQPSPEVWQVMVTDEGDGDEVKQLLPPGEVGIVHQGVTDAITRLVDGASQDLGQTLVALGQPSEGAETIADELRSRMTIPLAWQGMPLGESIELARFLVDTTINFVRFSPGDLTVGGPIEIAALTKHEGFKWVQRKHYYSPSLNPTEDVI